MDKLESVFQYILDNLYLRFLLTLVITLVMAYVAKFIFVKVLKPLTKRTKTKIDDLIVKTLSSVIFYIVFALGLKIGFEHFDFETTVYTSIIDTLLILIICILLVRIINRLSHYWLTEWASRTESSADDRLIPLIEKILKVIVIALAIIFVFDSWKINVSPLLATAGIAGIAISFAVKDALTNVLGGLQLVLDKTFKVGDKIELESGELGEVLDIGLRSTKLRTYDNETIYIPNGYLANAKIKNFTMPDLSLRVSVEFGVEYGSDAEKVRKIALEAIRKIETVLSDPEPDVLFLNMGDFSLNFRARAWVASYTEAFSTKLKMTEIIYNALNKAGIGIPFPTRTLYTKSLD